MPTEDNDFRLVRQGEHKIYFPALDEVFRIPGDLPWATQQEKEARRRLMFKRIQQSPTPASVRKLQRWAQKTDDVQDFLVTIDVAMRIGIRVLKRWTPKLASKVVTRFIPYLGWILLFGDILNIATGILSLPSGPWALKRLIESAIQGLPGRSKSVKKAATKLGQLTTTWRDWIQVAQTSENATGVGLRLGGIMGFITDCLYGMIEGTQIVPPWQLPGSLERKAYKALQASQEIGSYIDILAPEDIARVYLAQEEAMLYLRAQSAYNDWPANALLNKDFAFPTHVYMPEAWYSQERDPGSAIGTATQVQNPASITILGEMGIDPEEDVGFIGKGNPETTTVTDILAENPDTFGEPLTKALYDNPEYWFMNSALQSLAQADEAVDSMLKIAFGDSYSFFKSEWRGITYSFYYHQYPPEGTSHAAMLACWTEVGDFIADHNRMPDDVEICAIAFKHWGSIDRKRPTRSPWEIIY